MCHALYIPCILDHAMFFLFHLSSTYDVGDSFLLLCLSSSHKSLDVHKFDRVTICTFLSVVYVVDGAALILHDLNIDQKLVGCPMTQYSGGGVSPTCYLRGD